MGMTNFQIGILFFMGIITYTIIGATIFIIFNMNEKNQNTISVFSNPEKEIIGKWEDENGLIYEFFPDGTISNNGIAGKYSFPDNTHIKIEYLGMTIVHEYNLSNNILTMGNMKLRRIIE
jgi:hypothetical protein